MATTTKQAKYKQINADGSITLFHYQTNADIVVDGASKRVPTNAEATKWNATSTEVNNARTALGGTTYDSLDLRLENIETNVLPTNLLNAIKTVDGSGSGLDSDLVDGCGVNDSAAASATNLWTSNKIKAYLDAKVDDTEVSTVATANKLLKLNSSGLLPTGITGNAATATKLATGRNISLSGDATGSVLFDGTKNVAISVSIGDNTHNHSGVSVNGTTTAENLGLSGDIINFKQAGVSKSSIDGNGNFTGRAATATKLSAPKAISFFGDVNGTFNFDGSSDVTTNLAVNSINGKTVNDASTANTSLWTAAKVISAIGGNSITSSKATNGYVKVAGLTIQWGVADLSNVTSKAVTFPIPFTSAPYSVTYGDSGTDFTWFVKRPHALTTSTGMTFISNKSKADSLVSWVAIGV